MTNKIVEVTKKINKLNSLKEYNVDDFVRFDGDVDILTRQLKNDDIKTTQLRKFFAAVKEINLETKTKNWNELKVKFFLLMPKLAYAKGRKLISEDFYKLLESTMNKVQSKEDFNRFVEFLEAIVAFYKANKPRSL